MSTDRQPGPRTVPDAPSSPGPESPAGEFARAILGRLAGVWKRHDEAARTSDDPRHVHAMRVAAQRARAALRAYADVLPGEPLALRADVGSVRRTLGPVRDLDVQIRWLERHRRRALMGDAPIDELVARLADRRVAAFRHAVIALDLPAARAAVRQLEEMEHRGPGGGADTPAIGAFAPRTVRKALKRARSARRAFERAPGAESAHRLRRRCRELRYVLEFHEPLWGESAGAMIVRIVRLQDRLGTRQDAAVARAWIERLLVEDGGELSRPAVFEAGRLHERATRREAAKDASELARAARAVLCRRAWRPVRRAAARHAGA